ncbi:MAG: glutamine amidotransferase family protein [Armatimonadota bacterium]|nr:glutamine amidotransferase family protein [bacterium]
MRDLSMVCNPYNEDKVISACSIFGMMDVSGKPFSGEPVFRAMENMHDRGNGLGGGFAVYGIYPEFPDHYALHIMYTSQAARHETEQYLEPRFLVERSEEIPTRKTDGINNEPLVYRYFVLPKIPKQSEVTEEDFMVEQVLRVNAEIDGAFVFSSGKNMGVFKGVGFPEQIARYFRLEEYQGHIWTAHGRFPTNSQAWWGGAHPFCMLDWTVVHNGELSSYGANRAYLETIGYKCTMFTDTEVLTYAIDLILRREKLPPEIFARVISPPLWEEIDRMPEDERKLQTALRSVYGGLLMNGPFSIVVANGSQMIAVTDRIRLRPLTAATKDSTLYFSSEEASIRLVSLELDHVWTPMGGVPVIGKLGALPVPEQSTKRNYTTSTPVEVAR